MAGTRWGVSPPDAIRQCLRASHLLCGHSHPSGWHLTRPPRTVGETEARRNKGPVLTTASPTGHPPRGAGREQSGLTAKTPCPPPPARVGRFPPALSTLGGLSRAVPAPFLAGTSSWVGWREGGLSRGAQGQRNEGVQTGWVRAEPRGWRAGGLLTQGPQPGVSSCVLWSLPSSPAAPTQPSAQPLGHCQEEGTESLAWARAPGAPAGAPSVATQAPALSPAMPSLASGARGAREHLLSSPSKGPGSGTGGSRPWSKELTALLLEKALG